MKLTKRVIEGLKATHKDQVYWDDAMPGFGVRVKWPSQVKSFCLQFRNAQGRSRRLTIGRVGVLTVDQARDKARELLVEVTDGKDPVQERMDEREAMHVRDLAAMYMERHARVHKKPLSIEMDERLLDNVLLPALGHLKAEAVTRKDVERLHYDGRNYPVRANRVLALASTMFTLAEVWGIRQQNTNPVKGIKRYPEKGRERALTPDELARLGTTLNEIEKVGAEFPTVPLALRLLLLTGCRKMEILGLRWEQVSLDAGQFVLEGHETKGKLKTKSRAIPLSKAAVEVLHSAPRMENNPYVCWGSKPGHHLVGLNRAWKRICDRAGLEGLTVHDLRHVAATSAIQAGLDLKTVADLLGHSRTRVTEKYVNLGLDPLRAAADKLANHLEDVMNKPVKSKVVSLKDRREGAK